MLCVVSSSSSLYSPKNKYSVNPPKKVSTFTIQKKNEMRKTLRTKLKKALTYCDHTKDDILSEACEALWEEIDTLSDDVQKYKEE